jgi:long-chain acyl-CoA synthetase
MAGKTARPTDPHAAPPTATLLVAPLAHVTSCCVSLVPTLMRGGKLVFMRWWAAEEALRLIERERVTLAGGVPTIAMQILEHPARHHYDLSSLKYLHYGGAPAAGDLAERIAETFTGTTPVCGYGMTETCATFTNQFGAEYRGHPLSCGPASPVGEIRIVDLQTGTARAVGQVGEIWLKGPNVVRGYWNRAQETAETFVDGWLRTGDMGRLDEDGYLYIVDRLKEMVIRGGENIYCREVEIVLESHPAVAEAALYGVPHRLFGEEPVAAVHLKVGTETTEQELRRFVRDRLAAFKTPVQIIFWEEALPRSATGKILKGQFLKGVQSE